MSSILKKGALYVLILCLFTACGNKAEPEETSTLQIDLTADLEAEAEKLEAVIETLKENPSDDAALEEARRELEALIEALESQTP